MVVQFDQREVVYDFGELDELALAYAITIHKSQGSEFPAVVMPLAMQHYLLLQRNLIYTGITRGKRLVVLVGQTKALALAVRNNRTRHRFSGLLARLRRVESAPGQLLLFLQLERDAGRGDEASEFGHTVKADLQSLARTAGEHGCHFAVPSAVLLSRRRVSSPPSMPQVPRVTDRPVVISRCT